MTARVAILMTHPVQYFAPWYRALARAPGIELSVFFMHRQSAQEQGKAGFGVSFEWDVPLLDGYRHEFLANIAAHPGLHSYQGCDVPRIAQFLESDTFDVLIVQGWSYKGYWQAIEAAQRKGIPVLVRGDSHLHTQRASWWRAFKYPFYRRFIPTFDSYLTAGRWNEEYYAHYGADTSRFFRVPHTVDESLFNPANAAARSQASLRERWGLPPTKTVFLFAGKLLPVKRPRDFVRALAMAAKHAPVAGLVVGDGPMRVALEHEARQLGAPVYFRGFLNQSEMPEAYRCADALVVSSEQETWGLVVNEAMASGRPAVVSDTVGCGVDLVQENKTGFVYHMGSVPALARRLEALANDPAATKEMGENARAQMKAFSIEEAVHGTERAIKSVRKEGKVALCA